MIDLRKRLCKRPIDYHRDYTKFLSKAPIQVKRLKDESVEVTIYDWTFKLTENQRCVLSWRLNRS